MTVIKQKPDGSTTRSAKELKSEAEARSASEGIARELVSRGYVEKAPTGSGKSPVSRPAAAPDRLDGGSLFEDSDSLGGAAAEPVLSRLADAPAAGAKEKDTPKKKKAGGKKKRKNAEGAGDALDKRVLAGVGAVGVALVLLAGYVAYDLLLKPATIVGDWAGSMVQFETGGPMIYTQYHLVLDAQKKASMTLQDKYTSVGTYTVKGNRLKLTFKDEEGDVSEREYKIALRRTTLDLFDPTTNKKVVQLLRLGDTPATGKAAPPAAPAEVATDTDKFDKAEDDRLVSVAFSPKDGAFRLRHPQGWETDTGSRPDNLYSWASFTKGSAKIQVFADATGSLMAGTPNGNEEEGSELAPVHNAHELNKKKIAEDFTDYNEGKPAVFKGSQLGEGRIAVFTAGGGLLSPKLRGYRVTLLTNDRRITVLCQCPDRDFAKYKPTFLALSRSLSR
jgi:hypothetical protein